MSVGVTIGEQRVVVRDLNTNERCADGEIGEICVAGPSVAPGYWQQYEQTLATFQRGIGGETGQAFAGTGDLGFHHRGDLYVTGRLKDMIIIAGRNYYSEDIEYAVIGSRPELVPNGCAAFTVDAGDEERLVVVAEIERTHRKGDLDALLKGIREAIWLRHDLSPGAVLLVSPGSVPKTSSGKVRRGECRKRLGDGELTVLARWDADDCIAAATRGDAAANAPSNVPSSAPSSAPAPATATAPAAPAEKRRRPTRPAPLRRTPRKSSSSRTGCATTRARGSIREPSTSAAPSRRTSCSISATKGCSACRSIARTAASASRTAKCCRWCRNWPRSIRRSPSSSA